MLADVFTPVGIYLRLRDRFRDTILLESADHHGSENSYSFICINAIGGFEAKADGNVEYKFPGQNPGRSTVTDLPEQIWEYMNRFEVTPSIDKEAKFAQGLYGYTTYDAVQFFETIRSSNKNSFSIPLMRYRLYQYVIAIDHFRDELILCENKIAGVENDPDSVLSLIRNKDVPEYPFKTAGEERSNLKDEEFIGMVKKGIAACHRGDVFQIVLSRKYSQAFTGDEFNVYRSLRSINPSPYLFFFDYGDYKLMGSSPEAQLKINNGQAILHPIAGTFKRTGDDEADKEATERLRNDRKENAEHVMLVDLARNDLSRVCSDVKVAKYREVQYFSHVIHLVSEVTGKVEIGANPFKIMAVTFPAGTLSGAPKYKAMQLIDAFEPESRGYYGGSIGFMGFNGTCNHAIMIRTFLSRNNVLSYQAGAGVVAASVPENELQEVNNKLAALKKAVQSSESRVQSSEFRVKSSEL